jgi:hypothetical protein
MKKLILASLALAIATILFLYARKSQRKAIPDQKIEAAISFLQGCNSLRLEHQEVWEKVFTTDFRILFVPYDEPGVCARYFLGTIIIHPVTLDGNTCYEGHVEYVIAHEMLHALGMPPHTLPIRTQTEFDYYLRHDPIELAVAACRAEFDYGYSTKPKKGTKHAAQKR